MDGETVAYVDGVEFPTALAGEEFVEAVRQEAGPKNVSETSIAPSPTTPGMALTQDKFRDLITVEDVETRLTAEVSLKVEFRDFKEMAGRENPSQVEKIDSWYGITMDTLDGGSGITFSVIDFDSASSAEDHYRTITSEESGLEEMPSPIGDTSAQVAVNAEGIRSMLVFLSRDKVVSLHTTKSPEQAPLVSLETLGELAALVVSEL